MAVFVEFRGRTVERQSNVFTQLVTSGFSSQLDHCQGFSIRGQIGCKTTLIPHCRAQTLAAEDFFQLMKDLSTHLQGFREAFSPNWLHHKFLYINIVIRVLTTVNNIHHRHRHAVLTWGAVNVGYMGIQRNTLINGGGLSGGQRNGENRIGAQCGFVLGAIGIDH